MWAQLPPSSMNSGRIYRVSFFIGTRPTALMHSSARRMLPKSRISRTRNRSSPACFLALLRLCTAGCLFGGAFAGTNFQCLQCGKILIDQSVALLCFFFNDTATTEIYTLSLHDALPI